MAQVRAAQFWGGVGAAAVEDDAGEGDNAACGDFCNEAGVAAKVADFVVAAFFNDVVYPRANAATRIGQEMDGAVFFAHVVERTPAGEIRFVVGITDIARVLVPREFHTGFRTFDDVLFPKEVRIFAEGGTAYFGHEVAEEEGAKFGLLAKAVGDEVAFVAVVDADGVRALFVHACVHGVDKGLAFVAQEFEVVLGYDGFEDEIAFVFVLLFLRFGDGDGHGESQDRISRTPGHSRQMSVYASLPISSVSLCLRRVMVARRTLGDALRQAPWTT